MESVYAAIQSTHPLCFWNGSSLNQMLLPEWALDCNVR